MRKHVQLERPRRSPLALRRVPRAAAVPRSVVQPSARAPGRDLSAVSDSPLPAAALETNPYVDYGRLLTAEGGILIGYKDIDRRIRCILWRVLAWSAFTAFAGWLLLLHSPVQGAWINLPLFFVMMFVNYFIVRRPIGIQRKVEIRPDCMILEGKDVFWLRLMETAWPAFHPDEEGDQVLSGVYGTRLVEYLTVPRFDDNDRAPEVFAAHLHEAMEQLWAPALGLGRAQFGQGTRQGR